MQWLAYLSHCFSWHSAKQNFPECWFLFCCHRKITWAESKLQKNMATFAFSFKNNIHISSTIKCSQVTKSDPLRQSPHAARKAIRFCIDWLEDQIYFLDFCLGDSDLECYLTCSSKIYCVGLRILQRPMLLIHIIQKAAVGRNVLSQDQGDH